jgi:hypothetical protein
MRQYWLVKIEFKRPKPTLRSPGVWAHPLPKGTTTYTWAWRDRITMDYYKEELWVCGEDDKPFMCVRERRGY